MENHSPGQPSGASQAMSLNELSEYYPLRWQLRRRPGTHSTLTASERFHKRNKAVASRARSKTLAFARRQYYPTSAYTDMRAAIARNEDIFITAILLLVVLTFSVTTTGLQFLLTFMGTATAVADLTHISGSLILLVTFAVPAVLCSWVAAFLINLFSIALMDGAKRKRNQSVRRTVRHSLQAASRTANAWFMIIALLAIVPVACLVLSSLYLRADGSRAAITTIMPYTVLVCAAWCVYVLAQYSLAPTVALFEPDLTLTKVLGRSRHLVKRRGRIFTIVTYLLTAAGITAVYLLANQLQTSLHIDQAALVSVGSLAAILGAHGLFVMLYRKSKLARKN